MLWGAYLFFDVDWVAGFLGLLLWWATTVVGLLILMRWLPAKGKHASEGGTGRVDRGPVALDARSHRGAGGGHRLDDVLRDGRVRVMTARRALAMVLPVMLLATLGPAVSEAASKRPAVVETRTIGHTVKGRAIVAWRVGQPSSGRRVVVLSAMHGNETGPKRILVNLLDGRRIKGADIWLVPQYNRDGVVRRTRQNAHGVDLNRNYPRHWKRQGGAYNSGPRPASEPETKAVMAFLRKIRPTYVVSYHQPLNGVGRAGNKGAPFVRRLHRGTGLPSSRSTAPASATAP